jgi:MerR family transcriptional regulator, copper efflux regulator
VADLDRRIAEMMDMRRTLETLVHCCRGNDRPDCPILDDLADQDQPPAPRIGARGKTLATAAPRRGATTAKDVR